MSPDIVLIMWIIKVFVILPFIFGISLLAWFIKTPSYSISNLREEKVKYVRCYINKTYAGRIYQKIVIDAKTREYHLYPYTQIIPEKIRFEEVVTLLNQSSEAIIWVREAGDPFVMGIQTEHLNIPPSRGVEWQNEDNKSALWGSLIIFVYSIFSYVYFKRYYGLNWKLQYKAE